MVPTHIQDGFASIIQITRVFTHFSLPFAGEEDFTYATQDQDYDAL